jgi:acetyl/propionyl-CoA carboxylase alpha subunit
MLSALRRIWPALLRWRGPKRVRPSGTTRCISERLLDKPRHIEVQLPEMRTARCRSVERECSLQRRHQLVEESPSPSVK